MYVKIWHVRRYQINKIFHSDINELFLKFHEILNKFKNPLKDEN
jgi:hypothetical protein